jgi:hypothetical protein
MRTLRRRSHIALVAAVIGISIASGSAASRASTDDEKTVAAFDTQYQAAVAKNDAATMDRILADDFVLVTGNGRILTKADC